MDSLRFFVECRSKFPFGVVLVWFRDKFLLCFGLSDQIFARFFFYCLDPPLYLLVAGNCLVQGLFYLLVGVFVTRLIVLQVLNTISSLH